MKTDALGRITLSKEHRKALLDAFDESGLKGLEFARLHGVNYQTFASWVQKRRRERGLYPVEKPAINETLKLTLAEVDLPAAIEPPGAKDRTPAALVEILLPGGLSIRVTGSGSVPLAVELANALRPC
ncbi:MAG: hypothetical protein KF712_16205 [Akkermansiaceae bacterium]|nr:hypothetical protein [Akkermansiaceae bacterium]